MKSITIQKISISKVIFIPHSPLQQYYRLRNLLWRYQRELISFVRETFDWKLLSLNRGRWVRHTTIFDRLTPSSSLDLTRILNHLDLLFYFFLDGDSVISLSLPIGLWRRNELHHIIVFLFRDSHIWFNCHPRGGSGGHARRLIASLGESFCLPGASIS
jgi:hypothetical protein